MSLGKQLYKKRYAAGLSLRELSRIVGISFATLSRIERGDGNPSLASFRRVEKWLETGAASEPAVRSARNESWYQRIERRVAALETYLKIGD